MENQMDGSIDMRVDAILSYSWRVDSAIRSETASILGASPLHTFSSLVDSAIRSRTPSISISNWGASPLHTFASAVDNAAPRLFTLPEIQAATNNFSRNKKISDAGSFGVVYRAKLVDGREVAVKRGNARSNIKGPFKSELAFLSRLHHKHLVGLVGFCEGDYERLILVYEYMKNRSLYYHLHRKYSSVLNSWKKRIKIALDASRGIEYLHNNHVVPSIIHGRIKSANILLDATWTARVSDFELSFWCPESACDYRPMEAAAARSVGYIDPEYHDPNVLTPKSDVYGLGVVLLELLTGKRAIFKSGKDGDISLLSLVEVAVPAILAQDLVNILDPRVRLPNVNEALAVEIVAYTAIHCVSLEAQQRPTMAHVVLNLERALTITDCDSDNDPNDINRINSSEEGTTEVGPVTEILSNKNKVLGSKFIATFVKKIKRKQL
ncbi:putative serine/threonine-protein kinase-like protein CCR3 [Cajanus cajan]|uniref:putative serine/threonine-protein kinase-like protein CCR3 n=1 Tax=Cajanus cajan TaxID=3821 RepID=UPI00098DC68D|nr:putative serine/threonine-protein kinase-like protein CCR3 [Cajanus cajan]